MDPAGSKNCFWMGVAYFGWSQRKRSTHWSESRILTRKTRPVCIGRWPIFVQYISVYFFFLFEPWGPIDKIVRNFPLFSFPLYESQILFNFFLLKREIYSTKEKVSGAHFYDISAGSFTSTYRVHPLHLQNTCLCLNEAKIYWPIFPFPPIHLDIEPQQKC